jgi:sugar phosphate isomerase/epimerase
MPVQSHSLSRRRFLRAAVAAPATAAALGARAVEPFARPGAPRLGLSLAAYSFRDHFKDAEHPQEAVAGGARRMDLFQFLDFCAAHGCEGAELTSYYFPKDCDDAFLRRVKRHAFLSGLAVSGTSVGNTFTHPAGPKREREMALVKRWIDRAAVLGAPHVRVFAGSVQGTDGAEARRLCIAALEEACAYAGGRGIFLGLENHGGIVAGPDALLDIVRAVPSPWLGINLDTGNFHTADPYAALAQCAPYAVNVQFKVEIRAQGRPAEACDPARIVRLLRDAKYQGYVALEYEAKEDPHAAVPRHLAALRRALAST